MEGRRSALTLAVEKNDETLKNEEERTQKISIKRQRNNQWAPSFVSRSNSPTSLNPLGLLMQIYYFRSDKTLKINVVKLFLVRGFNLCKKSCLLACLALSLAVCAAPST